jgi:hypothetical protein
MSACPSSFSTAGVHLAAVSRVSELPPAGHVRRPHDRRAAVHAAMPRVLARGLLLTTAAQQEGHLSRPDGRLQYDEGAAPNSCTWTRHRPVLAPALREARRRLQDAARDLLRFGDSSRGVGRVDTPRGASSDVRALLAWVSFYDTPPVREAQLTEFLENWLAGRPADPVRADRDPSSVARSTPGRNDSESQSPALSPRTGPSDSARAAGPRQKHSRSCQGSGATCRTFRSTPLISRNCRNKAAPDPIEASWVDASGFIHATRGRSISKGVLLE